MFKGLRAFASKPIYVQIWENRLKASIFNSDEVFDQKALLAIKTDAKGRKIVVAIGDEAESHRAEGVEIARPFSHPRTLMGDYATAEKLLQHVISLLYADMFLPASPIVIIHLMEKVEGGLSQVEGRAFREMALSCGARTVYVHVGEPLPIMNFDIKSFEKQYDN